MAMVSVQYIGRRPFYKDALYGTGLTFATNETRNLPPDLAARFLRHVDLFAKAPEVTQAPQAEEVEETAFALDAARKAEQAKEEEAANFDVIDQVRQMDKTALAQFAKERFNLTLDKRRGLDELRNEVANEVARFGA